MPLLTKTLQANVFKNIYNDTNIQKTFNQDRILHAKLERKMPTQYSGTHFFYPAHTGGSVAGAHILEASTIGEAGQQQIGWMQFDQTIYVRPIQLSGKLIVATENRESAIMSALDLEASGAISDAKDDFASSYYRPSTGEITRCVGMPTSTTVFKVECPARLRVGQFICVANRNTGAVTHGYSAATVVLRLLYITNIANDGTITVAGAVLAGTPLTSWVLDEWGLADYSVFDANEFLLGTKSFGLEDIIDETATAMWADGTTAVTGGFSYAGTVRMVAGVPVAGTNWLCGNVFDAAGANITDRIAFHAMTQAETRGNCNISFWVCSPDIFEDILDLHTGDRRFNSSDKVAGNWFERATLANKPCYMDKFCTPRTIYGLDESKIWIAEEKATGWENRDGSWLHRLQAQYAYQALLTRHYQLCAYPNCHVKIKNVRSRIWT